MAATTVANLIVPEVYTDYQIEKTGENWALLELIPWNEYRNYK